MVYSYFKQSNTQKRKELVGIFIKNTVVEKLGEGARKNYSQKSKIIINFPNLYRKVVNLLMNFKACQVKLG